MRGSAVNKRVTESNVLGDLLVHTAGDERTDLDGEWRFKCGGRMGRA